MKKSLVSLLLILLITSVSASISITEPEPVYNLGDSIYLTLNLNPVSVSGSFIVSLNCGNNSLDVYKIIPATGHFTEGEEQTINHRIILTPKYIGTMKDECYITASLGGEQISTNAFQISNQISVTAGLNKLEYNPGEAMTLKVEAIKANGRKLNGFLETSNAIKLNKIIENGQAEETFAMPESTESGQYTLDLFIYDRDEEGNIMNYANTSLSFSIKAIPSLIETSLFETEATPGQNFEFLTTLFDQSGKEMNASISITLISPDGVETKLISNSGETSSIFFETNATPGEYRLMSQVQDIFDEKEFTLKELQKASFSFMDSILAVKNIGNTIYNKTIHVEIDDKTERLELHISPGEERRFSLNAPDGMYNVKVYDDTDSIEEKLYLTGNKISVDRLAGFSFITNSWFIWLLIIAILLAIGTAVYFKFRHRTRGAIKKEMKKISSAIASKVKSKGVVTLDEDEGMIDVSNSEIKEAISSAVLKGEKQNCALIVLKISNLPSITEEAKHKLAELLSIARKHKGMIELKDEYMIIIFSPLITKTFKNEVIAAKASQEIFKNLEEFNKNHSSKIEFNIGLNSGDLICSIENKKLKYASVGNTVLLAKKIADSDKEKLLVPSDFRKKIIRDLKVKKQGEVGKKDVYSVVKVTDREANEEKLKDILKRMGEK